jgi:hypothetical protein
MLYVFISYSWPLSPYLLQVWSLLLPLMTLKDARARGRTSLDERSVLRRDLCVAIHNTHKRRTSMTLAGFEPATLGSGQSQTHALDRAVTGLRIVYFYKL